MQHPIRLTWNEACSGIFGSISLAAWIFLLLPQVLENYQQGHADGISLTFLFIWFVGDVTNLAGALWARLVPTVIALAVYFCFADTVLIAQCLYYLGLKKTRAREKDADESTGGVLQSEHTPLLNRDATKPSNPTNPRRRLTDVTEENLGLPGSRRVSSANSLRRRSTHEDTSLSRILEEPTRTRATIKNTVSILGVCIVGAAGWAIAWKAGAWRPTPVGQEGSGDKTPVAAEILGYISAVCYLGARIPQIVKNQRERSCEGLSLLFFLLSLLGNLTYGAGILFHSLEREYVVTNIPWLIGSLGTIVEDVTIFIQFHVFGDTQEASAVV
ncbi:putative vacuolar amino acid transporter [Fulvia fulva]|uniref:Vacuolar amino acid transporter n=1 Tax=Passalora fulva TaxID=5499 RepID=A0A9Q8LF22_PASFU|nr:putative vacuolar amino acid transporter [Fulvia fulva]KAK4615682.1 putative vacuolar amino acid transporter [Fulvia fulva]KAK4616559.1 putative vacuolar amino acid transporter [Fulvia fulva]UJO16218.1 putative vacuolar amino acid transporter [Fulvia fulva]WPV18869.1 putative vacuolar amino acid transporter [Fulvia fulva]WPV34463.1 putative vacuolar amino acid transporter [Fulvia fulva]